MIINYYNENLGAFDCTKLHQHRYKYNLANLLVIRVLTKTKCTPCLRFVVTGHHLSTWGHNCFSSTMENIILSQFSLE